MSKINIVMDTSQYDMFRLCEQRFQYRYKFNLVPIGEQNENLDRGNLIHICTESYYESLKSGAKYDYAVAGALLKMREAATIQSDLPLEYVDSLLVTMEEYFDHWRVADQGFEIIEVEKPFIYLLHENDLAKIYMAGKIDLIISDNRYTNVPYDHKSFKRSGPVYGMSNQFKNYCVAANSDILFVNRIGVQKTLKPHEKFLRVPLTYDHLKLQQWKDNTIKVIMNYLHCEAENSWPLNETSCEKFNRKCEYYEVCDSSGQDAKDFKLATQFKVVTPWDVSKVLRKSSEQFKDAALEAEMKKEIEG
jgi:hypothetical protein